MSRAKRLAALFCAPLLPPRAEKKPLPDARAKVLTGEQILLIRSEGPRSTSWRRNTAARAATSRKSCVATRGGTSRTAAASCSVAAQYISGLGNKLFAFRDVLACLLCQVDVDIVQVCNTETVGSNGLPRCLHLPLQPSGPDLEGGLHLTRVCLSAIPRSR